MKLLQLRSMRIIGLSLVLSTAALAQAPSNPGADAKANSGVGKQATDTKEVDKGQNMILPSAGSAGPSAAPTMVYDCQKKPEECRTPATPSDKAGASQTSPIKP